MNRRNLLKFFSVSAVLLCHGFLCHGFSENSVISPAPGIWANRQALVIDAPSGSEIYYSFSGSDPLESGFAYDAPVMIDAAGDISLRIVVLEKENGLTKRSDCTVRYTVEEPSERYTGETRAFIDSIVQNPVKKYTSGKFLSIPDSFSFALNNMVAPSLRGKIKLSKRNTLSRYVPCSMSDGKSRYHFVIQVLPAQEKKEMIPTIPFEFKSWETFSFSGNSLIWQLDDGEWSAGMDPVYVDRSVPHVLRWQSVDYKEGNVPEEFVLPVKPEVFSRKLTDGSRNFRLKGDSRYSFDYGEYVACDVFPGERAVSSCSLPVYLDGNFQGFINHGFEINRSLPQKPVITSSSKKYYARDGVNLKLWSDQDTSIFYAVSSPLLSDAGFDQDSIPLFDTVSRGEFKEYGGGEIALKANSKNAVFYKVNAYCVDKSGNKSPETEYRIVVDRTNYYLSPQGHSLNDTSFGSSSVDGSFGSPFVTFREALDAINASDFTCIHASGKIVVPAGHHVISKNCKIVGNDCSFVFESGATLEIANASVAMENCYFEKNVMSESDTRFVDCVNSSLELKGCEFYGNFFGAGTILFLSKSSATIADSGITVQAGSYGCGISSVGGELEVSETRFSSVAPSCACVSASNAKVFFKSSDFILNGDEGRGIELVSCEASLLSNSFAGNFSSGVGKNHALWKVTSTVENLGNTSRGF